MAGWDCSAAFYHAPFDEDIVVIPPKGLRPAGFVWQLRRAMNGTRKASLAFGSVVREELVAMLAGPFAEVVVASMCFDSKGIDVAMVVRGDDFFAKGRAEALLQVDEYLKNKFRINLVSLAIKFFKRVIPCHLLACSRMWNIQITSRMQVRKQVCLQTQLNLLSKRKLATVAIHITANDECQMQIQKNSVG